MKCKICNKQIKDKKYREFCREECRIQKSRSDSREWKKLNPEKVNALNKNWNNNNKEKVINYKRKWNKNNILKKRESQKNYYLNNKRKILQKKKIRGELKENKRKRNKRERFRMKNDINFKLRKTISNSLSKAIKNKTKKIRDKYLKDLIDYSIDDLRIHLEKQFVNSMSWENHGSYWHIDHIIPISKLGVTNQKTWKLSNLQPLEKEINLRKNNKILSKEEISNMRKILQEEQTWKLKSMKQKN